MQQNTEEWLKWRFGVLGASDSNIIAGTAKGDLTIVDLITEKVTKKSNTDPESFILKKGHRVEEIAKAWFEIETMEDWPSLCAEHNELPFMAASLDGDNMDLEECCEVKYVGIDDFKIVESGRPLVHYRPQLQKQLFVTNRKINHLVVGTEKRDDAGKVLKGDDGMSVGFIFARVEVEPDEEYIKELVTRESAVWGIVQKVTESGDLDSIEQLCQMAGLITEVTEQLDVKRGELVTKFFAIKNKIEPLKKKIKTFEIEKEELATRIFDGVKWKKAKYRDVRLEIKSKQGSASYAKAWSALLGLAEEMIAVMADIPDQEDLVKRFKEYSLEDFRGLESTVFEIKKDKKMKDDPAENEEPKTDTGNGVYEKKCHELALLKQKKDGFNGEKLKEAIDFNLKKEDPIWVDKAIAKFKKFFEASAGGLP